MPSTSASLQPGSSSGLSLAVRLREGSQSAWEELVDLYAPLVDHWCLRRGVAAAERPDVVQEVFLAVYRSIAAFDPQRPGATFRGWLWRITLNKIRERARRTSGPAARAEAPPPRSCTKSPTRWPPRTTTKSRPIPEQPRCSRGGRWRRFGLRSSRAPGKPSGEPPSSAGPLPRRRRNSASRRLRSARPRAACCGGCGGSWGSDCERIAPEYAHRRRNKASGLCSTPA
jgi:RNA polymerase sigma-70 factor, ECF subfamily